MRARRFDWDEINLEHLAERDISREDVEAVCSQAFGPVIRAGRAGRGARTRFVLVGRTEDGEFLTIVLEPLGGEWYRPITGWVSMPDERRRWRRATKAKGK